MGAEDHGRVDLARPGVGFDDSVKEVGSGDGGVAVLHCCNFCVTSCGAVPNRGGNVVEDERGPTALGSDRGDP